MALGRRGRCGCLHGRLALGHIDRHFAWQVWRLATLTCILRRRRGTYGTGLALVAFVATLLHTALLRISFSHAQLCPRQLFHTHTALSHISFTHNFVSDNSFTYRFVRHNSFTHNFVTRNSFTHNYTTHSSYTYLLHIHTRTRNFVTYSSFTHKLLHTTLSPTALSHTQLFHIHKLPHTHTILSNAAL